MSKNLLFKVLIALCFVAVAVVWTLSAAEVITVRLDWLIAVFAFVLALVFILRGLFSKTVGIAKKLWIILGAVLVVAGVLALVGTFIDTKLVLPIIAIVVTVAVLLCVLATGGKKWDEADNTKVGYKDYRTRKREQEEREARERDRKDDE